MNVKKGRNKHEGHGRGGGRDEVVLVPAVTRFFRRTVPSGDLCSDMLAALCVSIASAS
jgi:hypothetical protein